jgi:hypothetical protein
MLLGASFNFVMNRLMRKQPISPQEVDAFASGLVDALWDGIAPYRT